MSFREDIRALRAKNFDMYMAINRKLNVHVDCSIRHVSDFIYLSAIDTVDCQFKYRSLHPLGNSNRIPSAGDSHAVGYLF